MLLSLDSSGQCLGSAVSNIETMGALLHEHHLPAVKVKPRHIAVIRPDDRLHILTADKCDTRRGAGAFAI
jgi:hypothetical protein